MKFSKTRDDIDRWWLPARPLTYAQKQHARETSPYFNKKLQRTERVLGKERKKLVNGRVHYFPPWSDIQVMCALDDPLHFFLYKLVRGSSHPQFVVEYFANDTRK